MEAAENKQKPQGPMAAPLDGVWFLALGGRSSIRARHYLVWSSWDYTENAGAAILFHKAVWTTPGDMKARNHADQWASECLAWLKRAIASGEPDAAKWPRAPRAFTLFLSPNPGRGEVYFDDRDPHEELPENITGVVARVAYALGDTWESWKDWRAAQPGLSTETVTLPDDSAT